MLRIRTSRAELLDGVLDRLEVYVEAGHAARIGYDAVLTHLAADGDDLRDAGHGEELRAHGEVRKLAQRHGIDGGARHGDEHDLAHHRGDRTHLGGHVLGKLLAHQLQALGDLLTRAVDLHRPVELHVDHRKANAGHRAHARDAGHAVHRRLDGEGDEQLDLLRGEAIDLGHQRDGRPVEVGEDIDGELPQRHQAVERQGQRADDDEQTVGKAGANDGIEHG
jgi:hypothetical protein